jgi:hypothetical protein
MAQPTGTSLNLELRSTAWSFAEAVATGKAREIAAFGTRGDGKTWTALAAMIWHAYNHHAAGYELPTKWVGAADTFTSHKAKTLETLVAAGWGGVWHLGDGGHLATCTVNGTELVNLRLLGVEDAGGMDRLRMECHGLWFEEPAPASVLVQSSGLSETSWLLGLTSQRLPTHAHVAMMTLNYPDADHWTWRRFVTDKAPGSMYLRIPPGERATTEQREEWARALANRPDMLRRLLAGEPGTLALGPQVAAGYSSAHVALEPFRVLEHLPVWLGHDGGHTPTTVIGQRVNGKVLIHAGLVTMEAGMRQHLEDTLRPWLAERSPWVLDKGGRELLQHRYDPTLDTGDQGDIDTSALRVLRQGLGGHFVPGPVSWEGRRDPMLAVFNQGSRGAMALQIHPGPDTDQLRKALEGRWYYPQTASGALRSDKPQKPNHPWEDLGDAFCYLIAGVAPHRAAGVDVSKLPRRAKTDYDPYSYSRSGPARRAMF